MSKDLREKIVVVSEKCGNHNGGMETIKNRNSRTEKCSTIPEIKNSLEQRKSFFFNGQNSSDLWDDVKQTDIDIIGALEGEKRKTANRKKYLKT